MKLYQIAIGVAISLPSIVALTTLKTPVRSYSDYPIPVPANDNAYDLGGGYNGDYEYCSDASPCTLTVPDDYDYSSDKGSFLPGTMEKGTHYDDAPAPKLHNQNHSSVNDDSSYGKDSYSYDGDDRSHDPAMSTRVDHH